ncbi:hypothetical protein AB0B25_15360 [Nocardia sp. NPDC049190]|uniref:hypothetical protein n=1 Tax=Nocardia sp. NPDC049190 TaxID=3155650 RepID=UPI00341021BE
MTSSPAAAPALRPGSPPGVPSSVFSPPFDKEQVITMSILSSREQIRTVSELAAAGKIRTQPSRRFEIGAHHANSLCECACNMRSAY